MSDRFELLSRNLAAINQVSEEAFTKLVAERQLQVSSVFHARAKLSTALGAAATTAAAVTMATAGSPLIFVGALGAGAVFTGGIVYNLLRKQYGDHQKTALNALRSETIKTHIGDELSIANSSFLARTLATIGQHVQQAKRDLETALQGAKAAPTVLNTARAEMNQDSLVETQKAVSMNMVGLHAMRTAISAQIHRLADAIYPDGERAHTEAAIRAQITHADATTTKVEQFKAVGQSASALVSGIRHAATAKVVGATENLTSKTYQIGSDTAALARSMFSRVIQAYQVLKGDVVATRKPTVASEVTQALLTANLSSSQFLGHAAQNMQAIRPNSSSTHQPPSA